MTLYIDRLNHTHPTHRHRPTRIRRSPVPHGRLIDADPGMDAPPSEQQLDRRFILRERCRCLPRLLRRKRAQVGYTQADLAERAGISLAVLRRYEDLDAPVEPSFEHGIHIFGALTIRREDVKDPMNRCDDCTWEAA